MSSHDLKNQTHVSIPTGGAGAAIRLVTGLGSFCPCLPTLKGLKSASVTTARLIVEEAQGQDSGPTHLAAQEVGGCLGLWYPLCQG